MRAKPSIEVLLNSILAWIQDSRFKAPQKSFDEKMNLGSRPVLKFNTEY